MPTGNNSPRNNDLPGQLVAGLDGVTYRPIAVNAAGELITAGSGGPVAANILTGILSHIVTTAAATIIIIPAGRTWRGSITISVDASNAAGTAAAQALGEVSIAGAGATPVAGTYWRCEARAGAGNPANATSGSQAANSITIPNVEIIAGGGAAASIQLTSTITGTNSRVDAMATGSLID